MGDGMHKVWIKAPDCDLWYNYLTQEFSQEPVDLNIEHDFSDFPEMTLNIEGRVPYDPNNVLTHHHNNGFGQVKNSPLSYRIDCVMEHAAELALEGHFLDDFTMLQTVTTDDLRQLPEYITKLWLEFDQEEEDIGSDEIRYTIWKVNCEGEILTLIDVARISDNEFGRIYLEQEDQLTGDITYVPIFENGDQHLSLIEPVDVSSRVPSMSSRVPSMSSRVPSMSSRVPSMSSRVPSMSSRVPSMRLARRMRSLMYKRIER
jgi:hypothetical protein